MLITDEFILNLFVKNNRINGRKTSKIKNTVKIKEYLEHRYNYFNGNYHDVILLIKNGFTEWPKCKTCNKYIEKPFSDNKLSPYRIYCSNKCKNINKDKIEKTKINNIKKWGFPATSQSEIVKDKQRKTKASKSKEEKDLIIIKSRETFMKNYGVEWVSKSEKVKEKTKNVWKNKSEEELQKIKDKKEDTCINKYGKKYYFQTEEFKEKTKQTILDKYEVEYSGQSKEKIEKTKETWLENWNAKHPVCSEKMKQRNLKDYGVEYFLQSKEMREKSKKTSLKNWGVEYPSQSEEVINKMNNTKRKNGTFNTSQPEENFYKYLINVFKQDDIIRQYKEERYPFYCDFYIKSLDLFIELNLHWTHNNHYFNKNNKKDLEILEQLKEKSLHKSYYKVAIDVWTKKDIEKLKAAKDNNLNYIVLWDEKDVNNIIKENKNEIFIKGKI